MKRLISAIVIIILLPVVFINGVILVNSLVYPNEIPSFFGWKPFIVLSGSMETEIYPGDIAVVKDVDTSTLKQNDVIAFKSGDIVITHRIVKIINEDGQVKFITKGDNNNTEDSERVLPENVEGLYKFKIGKLGNLAMFVQTPTGMICSLSVPFLLLVILNMRESYRTSKELNRQLEELKKRASESEDREKITK